MKRSGASSAFFAICKMSDMRHLTAIALTLGLLSACGKSEKPAGTSPAGTGSTPPPAAAPASVAPGGTVSNDPAAAVALQCGQRAHEVTGADGTSWYLRCPAGCTTGESVWGTDLYTDDSSVCRAAIHAQALSAANGGVVLVTWAPAQEAYAGSERNGVTTNDYGHWPRSFIVQAVDASGKPTTAAAKPLPEGSARVSCRMSPGNLGGDPGRQWRVSCPAGCGQNGSVWGTDVYTSDSPICSAAIHAGVVTVATGGDATITIEGAQTAFKGSTKNGITSNDYGEYGSSFRVSR
jgi:hypothetical protein